MDGIRWDEVYDIVAYKIDRKTKEITFIDLGTSFGDGIEINDAMDGFWQTVTDLGNYVAIGVTDVRVVLQQLKLSDEPITLFRRSHG